MREILFECSKTDFHVIHEKISTTFNVQFDRNNTFTIKGQEYHIDAFLEEIRDITRSVNTNWFYIQSIAINDDEVSYEETLECRKSLNQLLLALEGAINSCTNSERRNRTTEDIRNCLTLLAKLMIPFTKLETEFTLKLAAVNVNHHSCPVYHYLHTNLEVRYHLLSLCCICQFSDVLEEQVEKTIENLIVLASWTYNKEHRQVLGCNCIRHLWTFLQVICRKVDRNSFWQNVEKLTNNSEPLFVIHLMKELSELKDIPANFTLLETKFKQYLHTQCHDSILEALQVVEPLTTKLWISDAHIELYQMLWEHYSKRLNVSRKNYSTFTITDFTKLFVNVSYCRDCNDEFELFVGMLIEHLRIHPGHWGRFKGRVYSQLGVNKLKELNETGVTRVILLLVGLCGPFYDEVVKRVMSISEVFLMERDSGFVWNIYMAFIAMQVQQLKSLDKSATLMVKFLEEVSKDSTRYHLIKTFFTNYKCTFSDRMDLGQHLFFSSWLDKYLTTCYYPDFVSALQVLQILLEKVESVEFWCSWQPVFKDVIYPALKKSTTKQETPVEVGKVCGKLYLLSSEQAVDIFNYFNSESVSPGVSAEFIRVALGSNKVLLSHEQEVLVVQSWIKISLLTLHHSDQLNRIVLNLGIFPNKAKLYMLSSPDPLLAFVEQLGSNVKANRHSTTTKTLCEYTFGGIDKWLPLYLTQPENQTVIFRIYTIISLAFLHCGCMIYNQNTSSSPLTKLMQILLFPTEILIGKAPHPFLLEAVRKTWLVFFEALIDLNCNGTDVYLERSLRDLVTKYIPYFSVEENPMMKCFNNDKLMGIFLDKLAISYFKFHTNEADANIMKAIRIIKNIVESTTLIPVLKSIVDKLLYGLFELIIYHKQKGSVISLVKTLSSSIFYRQIESAFAATLVSITESHLAQNTTNYFQLMLVVANFVPGTVRKVMGDVKKQVRNVERLRGVGFDNQIRMQLEKLERSLSEREYIV